MQNGYFPDLEFLVVNGSNLHPLCDMASRHEAFDAGRNYSRSLGDVTVHQLTHSGNASSWKTIALYRWGKLAHTATRTKGASA